MVAPLRESPAAQGLNLESCLREAKPADQTLPENKTKPGKNNPSNRTPPKPGPLRP